MKSSRPGSAFFAVVMLAGAFAALRFAPVLAQTQSERVWLAGRYDGDRVIVYFDDVKFNGTIPFTAREIPGPVVFGFFTPMDLPPAYVAQLQDRPDAEHFKIGDQYELLTGASGVEAVTLTSLVGSESDEAVGNSSPIGALARLKDADALLFSTANYFAVRRLQPPSKNSTGPNGGKPREPARLLTGPIRFTALARIAALLNARMGSSLSEAERRAQRFEVQAFQVADGSVRYYARAEWKTPSTKDGEEKVLAAWIASTPAGRSGPSKSQPHRMAFLTRFRAC